MIESEPQVVQSLPAAAQDERLVRHRAYFYGLADQIFASENGNQTAYTQSREELAGLSVRDLLGSYAAMVASREIDLMESLLHRAGNVWFAIAGAGKEAVNVAMSWHLRPEDLKFPYYRDQAMALWCGVTPLDILRQATASRFDPFSGGRQMSSHFGSVEFGFPIGSTMTGSQALQAVGAASGLKLATKLGIENGRPDDTVVYMSIGDGTTSEGEVEEAIRDAVRNMSPIVLVVEDDGWAISTPIETNIPGGDVSRLYRQYEHISPEKHLEIIKLDGTDFIESYKVCQQIVQYMRERKGPVLLHAMVTRPLSHSSADTQAYYRQPEDLAEEAARDPIVRLATLLGNYDIDADRIKELNKLVSKEIRKAADQATSEPKLDPATITEHITNTPLNIRFKDFPTPEPENPLMEGEAVPMRDLINRVLLEEMEKNPRIIMFGQDIADFPEPGEPTEGLKGKGGVFHVTRGVGAAFPERVWNSPLAEATIVGTALGYALVGFTPVVEVQFRDYIHPAWQQLVDEVATFRWRSNGQFSCPMVIRVAYGDFLGGAGALWHSEAAVGPIAHYPGLRVIVPGLGSDAVGLLREAIVSGDPVVYLEPKSLYEAKLSRSPYPGPDYRVQFGKGRIAREGTDVTIVTYGNLLPRSLMAADKLESEYGVSAEVLDLRTVDGGYDRGIVYNSLEKTGYVVVADEDRAMAGFGSSVASEIASQWFHMLNGPVGRVHPIFSRVSYGPSGEKAVMPSIDSVVAEVLRVTGY